MSSSFWGEKIKSFLQKNLTITLHLWHRNIGNIAKLNFYILFIEAMLNLKFFHV